MASRTSVPSPYEPKDAIYQQYSVDEDKERLSLHYEKPAEFMTTVTGEPWHVYSCTRWEGEPTPAESQEAKLDEVAGLLKLGPGKRLLDVGCGWGGPLAYFSQRYGVDGVGITPVAAQVEHANARFDGLGVSARAVTAHWREYADEVGFDVIHSDEVAVHITDLTGYYRRMGELLRPGGRIFTGELHYTHPDHVATLSRGQQLINEIFGGTGNYRTLAEELSMLSQAGLELVSVTHVPLRHYVRTLEGWLGNMRRYRDRLLALVGDEYYRAFRAYLSLARRTLTGTTMTIDMIVAKRLGDA